MSGLAHAGYIRAVAAALEAAGVPVADWRADDGVPRDGWIPFDLARQVRLHGRPVWDHDEAGAAWSEMDGWRLLTVDDPGGRNVRSVHALDVTTVAAPSSVARAVTERAGIRSGGPGDIPPGSPGDIPPGSRGDIPPGEPGAATRRAADPSGSGPATGDPADRGTGEPTGARSSGAGRCPGSGESRAEEVDTDFAGRRAGTGDPAFEAALRRYSTGRTKCVDGWPEAAEGRG
ncbi:hypothetical protein FHR83_002468 [Actinoplanes campanulatus]|uniref:DUF6292 domain-containing protein n=1 Tax=Actinoplanes campanulatus TaxID=113559 RepID=A0A7W5AEY3_9ACTN|nr:DUF6292 family protein [Actinoplanes campanulatus]MBB3094805.1 hypothetical protein [Actinoplanes campanulatus]GGN07541.1 hypothetical protein GCM10010109_15930 [Actinoplanes campanulatus]GID36099.1 hypothetical protein Aca09nite_26050 [Actinoplanes campanulatus]